MKKILVPIDFSSASSWGFYYAYTLAKQLDAEIVVLHLYRPSYSDAISTLDSNSSILRELMKTKAEVMMQHLKACTQPPLAEGSKHLVKVSYLVEPGVGDAITAVARQLDIDLVVMGTHGAGRAYNKVFGSNTNRVIAKSHCPVLAIPSGVRCQKIEHILYATNFDLKDIDKIEQLASIAIKLKARIHCLHVCKIDDPIDESVANYFKRQVLSHFSNLRISCTNWSANTVADGLETFARINSVDMITMLTHNKSIWDMLLGERSITQMMALRNKIPVLAFHE
jgi:nucleotide-binding universal stress UspA family protein